MPDPKVDTAAELESAKSALAKAEADHAAALKADAENKPPEEIVTDLLEAIVMRLGNRPDLRAMLTALKTSAYPGAESELIDSSATFARTGVSR